MTLTVRLDPQLEKRLETYCLKRRQTKTEVLTRLLREHLSADDADTKTPFELARQFRLVGAFASGTADLSENRKRHLKRKLRAKHTR